MKQNEPIKPAGVGKSQVAFNVGRIPTQLDVGNGDILSIQQQEVIEQKSSAVSFARAISTATATSLKQDIQNNCFEILGMNGSFMSTGGIVSHVLQGGITGMDINWNASRVVVNSPLFYYNPSDRYLYFKKAGWYLVRVYLFAPLLNAGHEWGVRLISNITLTTPQYEDYATWMDYNHQFKHPYVNGTTIFNVPSTIQSVNNALPGFKVRIHSSANNVSFDTNTTNASLQVIRLSDLEYSSRRILTQA